METRLKNPPKDDASALRALIAELTARVATRDADLAQKDAKIAALEHQVALLTKWMFAQKSERRPVGNVDASLFQGSLLFPEIIEAAERTADLTGASGTVELKGPAERTPHTPRKKSGRRSEFPPHLPVIRTTFELPEAERNCGGCAAALHVVGEDVTKELERIEFTAVHEIARKKYACPSCRTGVRTAPGPDRVIDRGLLGVGFLAHLLTERFAHHMPYHRLERKYDDEGLALSRSVLCTSAVRGAELLEPIAKQIRKETLASGYVQTDDTEVLKLDRPAKVAAKCEMWTYRAPGIGVFYDFAEPKKRNSPLEVLRDFKGHVQADAHSCYEPLYKSGAIVEVACWAHARRKFVEAEKTEPDLAKQGVGLIGELYALERRAREEGLSPERVGELRRRDSAPWLKKIEDWMAATRPKVLERGPLGMAISYAQKNWRALNRYVEDGRLEIDNNGAERALRQVAVARNNWTFLGAEIGGTTAATMLTLIASAREAEIDPRAYLRDVLLRIARCADVATLTPRGWKARWLPEVLAHRDAILERFIAGEAALRNAGSAAARR